MNHELVVRPEAAEELKDSFMWYEVQSKGLGFDFFRCVDATISSISCSPLMYPEVHKNIRRALIRKFPFEIFYIIAESKIIILAVFHASRNPKHWKAR
jgi:plasmid stabilization system protein ParE